MRIESPIKCSAVHCSAVSCSAVHFCAEQCSAVQCFEVLCSAVPELQTEQILMGTVKPERGRVGSSYFSLFLLIKCKISIKEAFLMPITGI